MQSNSSKKNQETTKENETRIANGEVIHEVAAEEYEEQSDQD